MYQKTFVHHNPSTGVSVKITLITTRQHEDKKTSNNKGTLDFYMNPLTTEENCEKISHGD